MDCELITKAPRIGMFKVERPEIVAWEFEQYARLLTAAKAEGEECTRPCVSQGMQGCASAK